MRSVEDRALRGLSQSHQGFGATQGTGLAQGPTLTQGSSVLICAHLLICSRHQLADTSRHTGFCLSQGLPKYLSRSPDKEQKKTLPTSHWVPQVPTCVYPRLESAVSTLQTPIDSAAHPPPKLSGPASPHSQLLTAVHSACT